MVHIEGTVSVISMDDDNYIFPGGSELVSAVYEVSANGSFPDPVTVRLQHCVPIDSEKKASEMSVVIADTAQGPPYVFYELSEGIFRSGSSYVEFELTHFSLLAVVTWGWWKWWGLLVGHPVPFSATVFYLQNSMATFVVTKNLNAYISVSDMNFMLIFPVSMPNSLPFLAGCQK